MMMNDDDDDDSGADEDYDGSWVYNGFWSRCHDNHALKNC